MAGSLRGKAARGVLLISGLKVAGTIVGRVTQIIVPLFLSPADFGIFALATFYAGFLALISDLGLSTELVRRKERFEDAAETAFTLRIVMSLVILAASAIVGWVVATAYSDPRLRAPILIICGSFVFQSFALIPRTIATRRLDFPRAAVPDGLGKLSTALVTIALAVLGFAYWSPVYGALLGAAVGASLQVLASPWRPRMRFDRVLARQMVRFGQFVTLASLANFVAHSVDNAFVGFLLGVAPLGLYAFAYSWGVYFTSNLTSILGAVSFPILSTVSHAPERFRRAVLEYVRYYAYVGFCLSLGVLSLAPSFVNSIYGTRWSGAILSMQVLAPVGLLLGFGGVCSDALLAAGQSRKVFVAAALEMLILLVIVPVATLLGGIVGTSVAALGGASFFALALGTRVSKEASLDLRAWVEAVRPAAVGGLVASATAVLIQGLLGPSLSSLIVGLGTFLVLYVATLQALTRGRFLDEVRTLIRMAVPR